jgi:hypothetical protein
LAGEACAFFGLESDVDGVIEVFNDEVDGFWYPADACVGALESQAVIGLDELEDDVHVIVLG